MKKVNNQITLLLNLTSTKTYQLVKVTDQQQHRIVDLKEDNP